MGTLSLHADQVSILGATEEVLPADTKTASRFPVRLDGAGAGELVVSKVTRDGAAVSNGLFSARIETPPSALPKLVITSDPSPREPGKYVLTIEVPPNAKGSPPQALTVTLTRPAADLQTQPPLKFRRTIYLPGLADFVGTVPLREAGKKSGLTLLKTEWPFTLRQSDSTTVGEAALLTPERIGAGQTNLAHVRLTAQPPLGTSTGLLVVEAPELAAPFQQSIEITSRLWLFWLALVIGAGIGLGYWARVVLEQKRVREDALFAGSRQWWRIRNAVAETADPGFGRRLSHEADTLSEIFDDPTSTPKEILDASECARTNMEKILKEENELSQELLTKIATSRDGLGQAPDFPDSIGVVLARRLDALAQFEEALQKGKIGAASAALKAFEGDTTRALAPVLADWSRDVAAAARTIGSWPDIPGLDDSVDALRKQLPALEPGAAPLGQELAAARAATAVLRLRIGPHARRNLPALAEKVAAALEGRKVDVGEIRRAAKSVRDWGGNPAEEPEALADAMAAVAATLWAGMRQAGGEKVDTTKGFLEALDTLPPRERILGELLPAVEPASFRAIEIAPSPKTAPPRYSATILTAGRLVVGQSIQLSVDPIPLDAPISSVSWAIDGIPLADPEWKPIAAKVTAISAEVVFGDGTSVALSLRVRVAPASRAIDPAEYKKAAEKALGKQTLVAGVLILFAGVLIFRASWIGHLEDVFAALTWGFGTDIGLAKVLQLTKPVLDKTVPTQK
jgi:hypothetical protein